MSRRKLPLESANWWPIEQAFEHRRQQTGSAQLACWDLDDALQTGRLRARIRRSRDLREVLLPSVWKDDLCCSRRFLAQTTPSGKIRFRATRFAIFSHKLGEWPRFQWVQVWKPDYKKIFDAEAEAPSPSAQMQEALGRRGPKPVHSHADLQSVALVLARQRKPGAPEKTRTTVVDELREWCKQNKQKVPADSTLYEIVAAAFRLKPTLPR